MRIHFLWCFFAILAPLIYWFYKPQDSPALQENSAIHLASTSFPAPFTETYLETPSNPSVYTIYVPARNQQKNSPTIIWFHGLSKHCRRYLHAMNFMAHHGFNSIGFDIRGHGRSGGIRGYIKTFDDCLTDLNRTYNHYAPLIKGKLFLVGHSMGGLMLIRHLQKQSHKIPADLCVATSPCVYPHKNILPPYKQKIVKLLALFKPKLNLSVDENDHRYHHTDDEMMQQEGKEDPYVIKAITAHGIAQTLPELDHLMRDSTKITIPFHILASGKDDVVDTEKTKEFYALLPKEIEKSITIYDTMNHSILHDVDRISALNKLLYLLQTKLTKQPHSAIPLLSSWLTEKSHCIGNWCSKIYNSTANWLHQRS